MSNVFNQHRFSYPSVVWLGPTTTDGYRAHDQASTETFLIRAGTETAAITHADVGDAPADAATR